MHSSLCVCVGDPTVTTAMRGAAQGERRLDEEATAAGGATPGCQAKVATVATSPALVR